MYIVEASKKKLPLYQITTQRVMFCQIYCFLFKNDNEYSNTRLSLGHNDHRLKFILSIIRYKVKKNKTIQNLFFITRQYWAMNENNSFSLNTLLVR